MSAEFYCRCEMCDGTRKLTREIRSPKGPIEVGSPCPFCKDGYEKAGCTQGQIDMIIADRDQLLEFVDRIRNLETFNDMGRLMYEAEQLLRGRKGQVDLYRENQKRAKPSPAPPSPSSPSSS